MLDAHHQAWIVLRELREREIGMSTVAAQNAVLNIVGREAHSAHVIGNPAKKPNVTQHRAADVVVDHSMQDQRILEIDPEGDLLISIPQVFLGA